MWAGLPKPGRWLRAPSALLWFGVSRNEAQGFSRWCANRRPVDWSTGGADHHPELSARAVWSRLDRLSNSEARQAGHR